jgi:hypothetical protein
VPTPKEFAVAWAALSSLLDDAAFPHHPRQAPTGSKHLEALTRARRVLDDCYWEACAHGLIDVAADERRDEWRHSRPSPKREGDLWAWIGPPTSDDRPCDAGDSLILSPSSRSRNARVDDTPRSQHG